MSKSQRFIAISVIVVLLLLAILIPNMLFTVDERQLAVVVRFGDPVAVYGEKDTGLHVKTPFIDKVRYLPRTYQFWTGAEGEILENLPTADGNKLEITPWAIWRITDAEQFVRTLVTVEAAERRVKQYVRSGVRDEITRNDLSEVVRSDTERVLKYPIQAALPAITDEPGATALEGTDVAQKISGQGRQAETITIGRRKIVESIKQAVAKRLLQADKKDGQSSRGIELVDLGIAKVDFVDIVREAAFDRLIAFWESIAARYTNEGERFKTEIVNRTNAEVQRIEGEGKEEANTKRGEVDAQIITDYAVAIKETGDFYNFIRMLEAYEAVLGSNTRLILTTDSELFRLLKEVKPTRN
jgi:membrane protease subunit HflC